LWEGDASSHSGWRRVGVTPRGRRNTAGDTLQGRGTAISTAREDTPIATAVAKLRARSSGQAPPDVTAVFDADERRLDAAGLPAGVVRPPIPFPDIDLHDMGGNVVSSATILAGRTTVVVFYRGTWCPYCNIALHAYRQLVPELRARGVSLIAVSPQKPEEPSEADPRDLPFPIFCDPGSKLADALSIMTTPTEDVRDAQAQLGFDLRTVNADHSAAIPMPTVALVDPSGVLRWIDAHPNYTTRTEPAQIIAALHLAAGVQP
jgi:peroxiredoxin